MPEEKTVAGLLHMLAEYLQTRGIHIVVNTQGDNAGSVEIDAVLPIPETKDKVHIIGGVDITIIKGVH